MTRTKFIHALTGLRFFAAMIVVIFHSGASFAKAAGFPMPIWNFLLNGYVGVSVFFVLSGLILFHNYSNDFSNFDVKKFFISRFARIYPVYILALILAFPFFGAELTAWEAVSVLLMVQSWVPLSSNNSFMWLMQAWTISVEMFFYISFPLIMIFVTRMKFYTTLSCFLLISALIVYFGVAFGVPGKIGDVSVAGINVIVPVFRIPEFILGVLICRLYQTSNVEFSSKILSLLQVSVVSSFVIICAFFSSAAFISFAVVLIGVFMFLLMFGGGICSKLLAHPVLVFLGGASYAIYLLNGPVRAICGYYLPDMAARLLSIPLTIAAASMVFVAYEQPLRRWIVRMGQREQRA